MDSVNAHLPVEVKATVSSLDGDTYAHLQISAPKGAQKRSPAAVICVLDISGSMDCEATQAGKAESDGFTRLDLVKHSVNTIIHSLEDGDYLGIVTFSSKGRVDLKLTEMNQMGKNNALTVIKAMKTEGCTNLWDGIKYGLQLSKDKVCDTKNTFVVVLSDGQPNEHPPGGEYETTRKYILEHPLTCCMSMFGYGYNLNTKLLSSLADLGGGCYGYIPDCSFVGTIFVNYLSLVLSTFSSRMSIQVESEHCQINQVNSLKLPIASLGPVQFGATRNCLVKLSVPPGTQDLCVIKIKYGSTQRLNTELKIKNEQSENNKLLRAQIFRYKHIELLHKASSNNNDNRQEYLKLLKQHYELINAYYTENGKEDKFLDSLMRDIESAKEQEGQVSLALTKQQYWNKWGVHYLPALKIAHQLQLCTNFKDPGLQLYGGQLFEKVQDKIDTIFIKLPPPEPSIKKYDQQGNLHVVNDMADYYDEYGGCIDGNCLVQMANGQHKMVKDVSAGDEVITYKGSKSKIKCTIKTPVNEKREMVKFESGLVITKYHPIIVNGSWKFPIDQKEAQKIYVEAYYNFVLEENHSMMINGVSCITLGHGFEQGVAKHTFLGTNKVIDDLSRLPGWNMGNVQAQQQMFKRDPISHQIMRIF